MSRRLLIVEPDRSARTLMDRVLTAEGYTAEDYESAQHARLLLDDSAFDLAVVDEFGGSDTPLAEVRFLRERYPRLPLIVTGTMLSSAVLIDLLRAGIADALPKPFTPAELRDAVARVLASRVERREDALEFAAALASAREELCNGRLDAAARALARVHAVAPLDAEAMALEGLCAELSGRDPDASGAYRASLALRHDELTSTPDPYDGLARLSSYGDARPVSTLSPTFANAPLWIVADPTRDLAAVPDDLGPQFVVVLVLGLTTRDAPAIYFRESPRRAFAVVATHLRAERLAPLLPRIGKGKIVVGESAASRLDGTRLREIRTAVAP